MNHLRLCLSESPYFNVHPRMPRSRTTTEYGDAAIASQEVSNFVQRDKTPNSTGPLTALQLLLLALVAGVLASLVIVVASFYVGDLAIIGCAPSLYDYIQRGTWARADIWGYPVRVILALAFVVSVVGICLSGLLITRIRTK